MIVESSTNHFPNSQIDYPVRQHLKSAPCPVSQRQLKSGALTISQMVELRDYLEEPPTFHHHNWTCSPQKLF